LFTVAQKAELLVRLSGRWAESSFLIEQTLLRMGATGFRFFKIDFNVILSSRIKIMCVINLPDNCKVEEGPRIYLEFVQKVHKCLILIVVG
jgi:hypothetical protein